jgi:hypothetical protein
MSPLPGPWGGRGMRGAAMAVCCPGAPAVSRCTMGRASPHQACAHTRPVPWCVCQAWLPWSALPWGATPGQPEAWGERAGARA